MNNELRHRSAGKNVLIFRSDLLNYSETFIPAQAEKFQVFNPFYAGVKAVKGLRLPEARTLTATSSPRIANLIRWTALAGQMDPRFMNCIRRIHPELIHAHFEEGGLIMLPVAQRLKIPLFVTCHGYDVTTLNRLQRAAVVGTFYHALRTRLFQIARLCLGVSRFICDQMLLRGYPAKKVRLHYIGVDTEKFRPDPPVPKQATILFVGRLVEKKGCADLLQAMKKVNAKYPDVKLNVIGYGALQEELEAFAREARLNVQFLGRQPPEIVQQYLKEAMMFCIPSVRAQDGDSEGLGIVNLEAQASGIPVIGTLHGGIPEAVEHGVTGLLSPAHDPDALAENILTLLSDTALRTKMGVAARERTVRLFDLSKQSALLEQIYREML
jgi:colanic acid/amylovoran biosynthesis glycosyltransferase